MERNGLKKIFGLFAAAARAATGLTCCGGGGGDSLSGKTYRFVPVGTQGDTHMDLTVNEQIDSDKTMYYATVNFGGQPYNGMVTKVEPTAGGDVKLTVNVFGDQKFGEDTNVWTFFASLMGDQELQEGDAIMGLPAPMFELKYTDKNKQVGTYIFSINVLKNDEDGEGAAPQADDDDNNGAGAVNGDNVTLEYETVTSNTPGKFYLLY